MIMQRHNLVIFLLVLLGQYNIVILLLCTIIYYNIFQTIIHIILIMSFHSHITVMLLCFIGQYNTYLVILCKYFIIFCDSCNIFWHRQSPKLEQLFRQKEPFVSRNNSKIWRAVKQFRHISIYASTISPIISMS